MSTKRQTVSGTSSCLILILIGLLVAVLLAGVVLVVGVIPSFRHGNACNSFLASGDYLQAISECEAAIHSDVFSLFPRLATMLHDARDGRKEQLYQRGIAEVQLNNWSAAEVLFRQVAELDVNYKDVQAQRQAVMSKLREAGIPTATVGTDVVPIMTLGPLPVPSETPTPTLTPLPTETPIPTATPQPSDTPTPIPPPPEFSDNFDGGLKAEWQRQAGEWGIVNGRLTLTDISERPAIGWITVGHESWSNYAVECDIEGVGDGVPGLFASYLDSTVPKAYADAAMNDPDARLWSYSRAAILVSLDSRGRGVGFIVGTSYMEWAIYENGTWKTVGATLTENDRDDGTVHLRIEVTETGHVVRVNGKEISFSALDVATQGKVGIWLSAHHEFENTHPRAVPKVDNLTITPLR